MLQYGLKEDHQMCSSFYKHYMALEYYPKNMEQEIEDKLGNKTHEFYAKYYSEPEVWYIVDTIVSLLTSFKERGYHHGDIQPKNIFIDPHGFIKISDNSLVNYGRTGYLKMVYEPGYKAALSPQLLTALQSKALYPNHDPIKSDIWAVGITALCAALNLRIDNFYDFTLGTLRKDAFKVSYDKMSSLGFSHQLISTIQGFLDESEDRRTTLEEAHTFLSKYMDAIKRGQQSFSNRGSVAPGHVGGPNSVNPAAFAVPNTAVSTFPGQAGFAQQNAPRGSASQPIGYGVAPQGYQGQAVPAPVPRGVIQGGQPVANQRQLVESRYV